MGLVSPMILFAFVIFFGSDSYQWWGDRFHYELTNRYLFTRIADGAILGPLWRDDTLGGHIWATSVAPAPLAINILAGRFLQLSPLGIELVGNLTLYFVAAVSMYLYLRRVVSIGRESATASAGMFAATAYWVSVLIGNPEVPMATSCLPALLLMSHKIGWSAQNENWSRVALSTIGLSVLLYLFQIHSSVVAMPISLMLLLIYALTVLRTGRSVLLIICAVGIGVALYFPFLWSIVDATRHSSRFSGAVFFIDQQPPLNPFVWVAEARLVLARIALGHNQYGIYLVAVLIAVVWACIGPGWKEEHLLVQRILWFSLGTAVVIPLIEVFHLSIDYLKRDIPLVGGWSVSRFQYALSFSILTLVAWMLDRSVFLPRKTVTLSFQRISIRVALIAGGVIGGLQIVYSAYRMTQVPGSIYPQNMVLFAGLILYTIVTASLLVLLYRGARQQPVDFNIDWRDSNCKRLVTLVVLSVSLTTSVHAYRQGVVGMRGNDMEVEHQAVMSYAQRYAIPDDILAVKRINVSDGRFVDLTRPFYATKVGPGGESPLISLGGLRVPFGYSAAMPVWYERFIYIGINGMARWPRGIAQVEDTGRTNFEALGLLDVEYVLAPAGAKIPGYAPIPNFKFPGKTLFGVEDGSRVGPAFMSAGVACFASDEEALDYIHRAGLRDLQDRAVLVASDPHAGPLCRKQGDSQTERLPESVRVQRGTDRVTVQVETSMGGILTLADTYYPGWKVLVNGAERPLLRTYTTLRGVVIEPGRQVVEFIYDPKVFWFLFHLSNAVLGFLLLATLAVWLQEQFLAKRKLRTQGEAGL